jgi:diacylglycerol kinase (ATP)
MKGRPLRERLGFAVAGLWTGWQRERSFRTQVAMALGAVLLLVVIRPQPVWWALVAIVVALVLGMELLNSAIEAVIDLLHPGLHAEIKAAKDMVAGAVLTISVAALVVAMAMVIGTLG